MRKKLLRFLCAASLAIIAGQAHAQTTGTIIGVITDASTGKPVEGAVVIATSPNLQGEQTAVTGKDGSYAIRLLPSGQYKLMVQIAGFKPSDRSDIRLSADKTLRANMSVVPEAVTLEEQVVKTGIAPVVNVGSSEAGAVVSREFIANVPVGRSFQAIAQSVPQAAGDQYGVGFQGAQSPENTYLVDGLNITDPVYGAAPGTFTSRSAPTTLSNFLQEVDVKTGSFMAEYGRSTGGIINVITKSGSNEFHGEVFSNYRADNLITPNGKVVGRDGEALAYFTKPSAGSYNLDFGAQVGGPVLKDRLWFFAGFAPILQKTYYERYQRLNVLSSDVPGCTGATATDPRCRDAQGAAITNKIPGTERSQTTSTTSYQWAGKLTYLVNENNNVNISTYGQPTTLEVWTPFGLQDGNQLGETSLGAYGVRAAYSGKFLDKRLILEADLGWHGQRDKDNPNPYQQATPFVNWSDPQDYYNLTAFEPVPGCTDRMHCPIRGYATGGFGFTRDEKINRYQGKVGLTALVSAAGSHSIKGGVDLERNDYDHTKYYSGGFSFTARGSARADPALRANQFRAVRGYGNITSGFSTSNLNEVDAFGTMRRSSYANNFAYFLQDSWQVLTTGITVNAGLRLETQSMTNKVNSVDKLNIQDGLAPRLQAIWDFTGTGRGKVAANWGRFYWAIPLDMGDRAFGSETEVSFRMRMNCAQLAGNNLPTTNAAGQLYDPGAGVYGAFDPKKLIRADGRPVCDVATGAYSAQTSSGALFANTGAGNTPVQPGLKGSAVDMFGGQIEYEVLSDLSVGLEYSGRRQVRIIEDMSPDFDNTGQYFIANPGDNKTWTYNGVPYSARSTVAQDRSTGQFVTLNFPKPERSYDGLTLRLAKNFSRGWQAQASYTYSVLRGNYSGPAMVDYGTAGQGQLDPGITAAFDLPELLANTTGLLPGDHPHTVKLFGSYTWNLGPRFALTAGAAYTGQSGRPMNALGGHDIYGPGLGYIIEQGAAGRTPFTHQLDIRGALSYVIRAPYEVKFSVDLFNALNQQAVLLYDQNYTTEAVQPIQKSGCNVNAVGSANPVQKLQSACPDVAYLKTTAGTPVVPNANWGRPLASIRSFQTPIQMRFGLALAF